ESQHHGEIAGELGQFPPAFLTLFRPFRKLGNHIHRQQLHDDGGGDVRVNAHGKNRKVFQSPAAEDVQKPENVVGLDVQQIDIDVGGRNKGSDPEHDQNQQRVENAPPQVGDAKNLGEGLKH